MCLVNKKFLNIYHDEFFWSNKFKHDYFEYVTIKPKDLTYKQTYLELFNDINKPFPIFFKEKLLGYIWLNNANTTTEAFYKIGHFFDMMVPLEEHHKKCFIHILLNTSNSKQYVPNLMPDDIKCKDRLWQNTKGFEMILGEIIVGCQGNQPTTYIINFPDGSTVYGPYPSD